MTNFISTLINKINWRVRIKSKVFWVTMIPAILVLIKQILGIFGINIEIAALSDQLLNIVDTVFIILAVLGIVVDPTTAGVADSQKAMTYTEPKDDRGDDWFD